MALIDNALDYRLNNTRKEGGGFTRILKES